MGRRQNRMPRGKARALRKLLSLPELGKAERFVLIQHVRERRSLEAIAAKAGWTRRRAEEILGSAMIRYQREQARQRNEARIAHQDAREQAQAKRRAACAVAGCMEPEFARQLCSAHYGAWYRAGKGRVDLFIAAQSRQEAGGEATGLAGRLEPSDAGAGRIPAAEAAIANHQPKESDDAAVSR